MASPRTSLFMRVAAACLCVSACTSSSAAPQQFTLSGVGRIPGLGPAGEAGAGGSLQGPILGLRASGNRLLIIGDSILAGTANRYGGPMCPTLVPMGWRVVVEAEAGQPVQFGRTVLRRRLSEGWDAAVVFLGTNFGGDAEKYAKDLTAIVESLAPRPTLLLTATLFKPVMQDVNNVIRSVAASHSNVSVLDWGLLSVQPGTLNDDGIHPTTQGHQLLVSSIAAAVGNAPGGTGACLPALFTDDSLVNDDVMPTTTLPGVTTTTIAGATTTLPGVTTTSGPATTAVATSTTVRPTTTTVRK